MSAVSATEPWITFFGGKESAVSALHKLLQVMHTLDAHQEAQADAADALGNEPLTKEELALMLEWVKKN